MWCVMYFSSGRMAHQAVARLLKWFLWAGGIPLRRKRVLGKMASQERAAVIVAGPHASIWDAGSVSLACGMPSFVSRIENRSIPILGSKTFNLWVWACIPIAVRVYLSIVRVDDWFWCPVYYLLIIRGSTSIKSGFTGRSRSYFYTHNTFCIHWLINSSSYRHGWNTRRTASKITGTSPSVQTPGPIFFGKRSLIWLLLGATRQFLIFILKAEVLLKNEPLLLYFWTQVSGHQKA